MKARIFHLVLMISFLSSLIVAGDKSEISVETGYIDVPNGKLYYEAAGSGEETIIFIHDGLVHNVVWDDQFFIFADKYKVVRYDRRGYGYSPNPETTYSNVEDLHQVFNYLKIDKAILIGMSAGGRLAMDFTIQYPIKVSSMILVGAVVSGFTYSNHFYTRGGRLTTEDYANSDKLLKYYILEDPYEIAPKNKDAKENLWEIMKDFPQNIDFTKNTLAVQPERPAVENLNEVEASTLIVIGEFDIPDVFIHAGAIESGIPYSEKVIIQDAGHLVPFEQPEMFNEQVSNFLMGADFFKVIRVKGVKEAVDIFNLKRKDNNEWVPFTEVRMNALGYQYLQSGKVLEAIELFKLNVEAYSESFNVYDSLGEAYMNNGDMEFAIENYERSLELNSDNVNAIEMLKTLK